MVPTMLDSPFRWPFSFSLQLAEGQAGRQVLRLEIGRDDLEEIVVRRAGRRAGAAEEGKLLAARSADKFVARLADLALGERGHVGRDPVGDPMDEARPVAGVRVEHGEGEALRSLGRVRPDSCGETFSPLQFGPREGMSPTFFASISPSLKEAERG